MQTWTNWRCCFYVIAISFALSGQTLYGDLLVRGYNRQLHNRFDNQPQFIGNPYDWSGVAKSSGGRWATMVSSNYFISATHFHPTPGETLTIYGSNSVAGAKQVVNVVGGQQISGTDIWLGRIDTPTNFATYEVAALTDPNSFLNHELFVYGVAGNVSEPTAQMKVGRNTIDAFLPNFTFGSTTDVVLFDYDAPTGGVGPDEAMVQSGDSGAPSFMIIMGRPVLVGVHWFQYVDEDFTPASIGSGDSLIDRYTNAINTAMIGQQLRVITVPEPTTLALLTVPVLAWRFRRWHARAA